MEIQVKSSSATEGFKQAALAEWSRLNPKYARPGEGVRSMFVNGFREGLPGYFAPLRMTLWLVSYAARSAWRLVKL
jgi:hypothetical protein